ncbi:hypothetical protein Tco_1174575 [Tanacetum coccineum]
MFYPRFMKIIIHHFLKKDKSITMRNRTFMHTVRDDSLLGSMRFVSRHEDTQVYGAILPKSMTNQAMLDSVAYKTYYAIVSRAEPPKSKKPKMKYDSAISFEETLSKKKPTKAKKDVPSKKKPASKPKPTKKKAPVKADRGKGDGVGSQLKVLDESEDKTIITDEGTCAKPWVPDVPKYLFESENESWRDSSNDESNDNDSDEVNKDDDEDDVESDVNKGKKASDSEKTDSNNDENLNVNQNDDEEEEHEEEYSFEFNDDEEEYDELYKDVDFKSLDVEREKERKGDAEMTDADKNVSQERSYEQVVDDAHVTLITTQKTKGSTQRSSVSSDFANESSTLAPPLLTVPITAIPKTSTVAATTIPLIIQPFSSIPQMTIPTPVPTTEPTTSSILAHPYVASLFGFNQRVTALEQELSQVKQSYTTKFEKKAQAEKDKYIDIIEKLVKEIIKDEVKSQLPQILSKKISDFATPVIQSTINESLENVVLAKSSSQPQSTYEAATSLTEFKLKKIMLDKLEKMYSLKRGREDKDKDEDPLAGSDQGLKKRKTSKDDQGDDMGNTKDQPNVKEVSKHDWFKKPERPPTPNRDWNAGKQIDFRPPQTWINKMAKAGKPPTMS